jgi:hypothetical protein
MINYFFFFKKKKKFLNLVKYEKKNIRKKIKNKNVI